MTIILFEDYLRGVRDAATYAHNNYDEPRVDEIIDGTIAAEVRRQGEKDSGVLL